MSFWKWSRVAASNATADATINWAEGQAPSSVNDSARALMAAAAKYRDDGAGILATAGTATAYTVASFQSFDTLAHLDGARLVIVPHVASGAAPTLNVDGLGAKPINISTGVAVPTGFLLANCPYQLTYYNAGNEFILHNAFGVLPPLTGSSLTLANATISGVLTLSGAGTMVLPTGNSGQRPGTPTFGYLRFNTDFGTPEFFDGFAWRQPAVAQPIAAGFKNLLIANNAGTPDTKIDISADAATVETSGGIAFRKSAIAVTVNCTTTGANGLDSGALAASTWYYFWLIYNPTTDTLAGLASTSASAPTLPAGYNAKARLGANRTGGAATFNRVRQLGRQAQYVVSAGSPTPNLPIAASGAASGTISLAAFVPATASAVNLVLSANMGANPGNSATDSVAPNSAYGGAGSTSNPPLGGYSLFGTSSGASGISMPVRMQLETQSFVRSATSVASNLAVAVAGWEDNI